ncbi:MAG: N-acetylmuramoyl-L-alanine amidase [Chloroflexi bacterium]|nr:N-acetylmuramoyl-L-alanine amidase [Chloroflexota bacterium]
MRNLLLLLAIIFFLSASLQFTPVGEEAFSRQSLGEVAGKWLQDTVAEFGAGTLEGTQITARGNGEISLAGLAEGFLAQGSYLSPVHRPPMPFSALGLEWQGEVPAGTSLVIEARTSSDGNTWSEWMPFQEDDDISHQDEEAVGALLLVADSSYLQYRATLTSTDPTLTPILEQVEIAYINALPGPTVEEAQAMILPRDIGNGVDQPEIISRGGWGAKENLVFGNLEYEEPYKIVVHHTVTPNFTTDPAAMVRAVFYYHTVTRGWGDIGYNYLIDWQGNIYEGRRGGEGVVGHHASDYNYGSIGIALLGDFSQTEVPEAMEESLVNLIAWAADRYGFDPHGRSFFIDEDLPNIVGHRDLWSSSCPGEYGYKILPRVREAAWEKLLQFDPRVEFTLPAEFLQGEVTLEVKSPSPTTASLQLFLDDVLVAEGEHEIQWEWDTTSVQDGEHSLRAEAVSVNGRRTKVLRTAVVDNNPPSGELIIGEGTGFISSPQVTLTFKVEDQGSGVNMMQFIGPDGEPLAEWEEFAAKKEWSFSPEEGEKVLAVQFQDAAGHFSEVYTASAILDQTPPGDWARTLQVEGEEVRVRVEDALSGLDPEKVFYTVSSNGQGWYPWQAAQLFGPEGNPSGISVPLAEHGGWIRFRVLDRAGNESISPPYVLPGTLPIPLPGLPDLVLERVMVEPQKPESGEKVVISAVLHNQGGSPAAGFWVGLLLDPAQYPEQVLGELESDLAAKWFIPGLEPGSSVSLTTQDEESGFGGILADGPHTLYLLVDLPDKEKPQGLVDETDEENNRWGPIELQVGYPPPPPGLGQEIWEMILQYLQGWLAQLQEVSTSFFGGI